MQLRGRLAQACTGLHYSCALLAPAPPTNAGMELQLLSPLPPPPDGVWAAPAPAGGPPLAVDAAEGGLAGALRSHVPGGPVGTCVLSVAREGRVPPAAEL